MRVVARAAFFGLLAAVASAQDVLLFPGAELPGLIDLDIDDDGLKDAIGLENGAIYLRHGHGNGTFGPATEIESSFALSLDIGDVTGDGVPDLVILTDDFPASHPDMTLAVLPGLGSAFGAAIETVLPHDLILGQHVLADMDGDGLLDWVAAALTDFQTGAAEVAVAVSSGTGTFTLSAPLTLADYVAGFAIGDFDGDGTLDVATTDSASPTVRVWPGLGDGSLDTTPVSTPLVLPAAGLVPALTSRDLDGDGLTDLAAVAQLFLTAPDDGYVMLLRAIGSGTFAQQTSLLIPGPGRAMFGDADDDDVLDVVVAMGVGNFETNTDSGLATLLGDGVGGFGAPVISDSVGGLDAVGLVDIDGDGLLDANMGNAFVAGRGDGSFVGSSDVALGNPAPRSIASADMDQDGQRDVVATRKKFGEGLAVLLGNGDLSFELHEPVLPGCDNLVLGDLDGDADTDIVVNGGITGAATTILLNDGSGTGFTGPTTAASYSAAHFALADVDGDGALDLLATHPTTHKLNLLRGDGLGGFLPAEVLDVGGLADLVSASDLDLDGKPDIAVTLTSAPTLVTLAGLGGGSFGAPQPFVLPIEPETLVFSDLDGDELPDLAVAFEDVWGHSLHVLPAQAPGLFGTSYEIPGVWNVDVLRAADLDADGWTDLLALRAGWELWSFRNEAGNGFATASETLLDSGQDCLVLDDFNGDGRPDAALASRFFETLTFVPNVLPDFPNLGFQHPSRGSTPHLLTAGAPVPHTIVSFTVTGVPDQAPGFLVLGLAFAPQPFAGGTLVPSPDVAVPMPAGVTLSGRWPELPAGTAVYAQAWFAGGGGVQATNAIMGIAK